MKTERSILKNTVFLTTGKGLGDLCTFLFLVYFARYFGKDIVGKYAFAMSLGGLLTVIINFGLNTLMVREVSKDKGLNSKYMGNLLVTQGLFAVIAWILIALIVLVSNFSNDTKLIIIIIGSYHVFYKLTMLFRAQFRAHEEMQYPAFLEIFHKLLILFWGIMSIIIWKNPIITLSIYPISAFVMFIVGFIISVSKYKWPDLRIDYVFIKDSLINAIPFFVIMILAQIYGRIGVILLTYLKGETEVGVFSASDRLLVSISTGIGMFGSAILPVMSKLFAESKSELFKLYERSVRLMLVALLPLSTMIFLLSDQIIITIFGEGFIGSVPVLQILAWTLSFKGIKCVLTNLLVVANYQNKIIKIRSPIYIGFFVAILTLIPQHGLIGLAYAILATEFLLFITVYIYASKVVHNINILKMAAVPIISCLFTTLVYYLMGNVYLWIKVSSSLIVCISTMFIFKGIKRHDLDFVKKIIFSSDS